jgi:hypothetical protein
MREELTSDVTEPTPDAPAQGERSLPPIAQPRTIVGRKWGEARAYLIHHLPRGILNNSSNLVGAMQLVAEMFMFKSSNNNLITPGNEGKPLHYLIDPPVNIVRNTFQRAKFGRGEWSDLLRPKKIWRELNALEEAAMRDRAGNTVKLTNRWSVRAGFTGMTSMALSTFLPEYSESEEETLAMVDMAHDHPLRYVGLRFAQALNPLAVFHNKRPLVGLGMTSAGVLSVLSGFRQVEGPFHAPNGVNVHTPQTYRRNPWQMIGGFITMAAGSQLFLAVNNEQGWRSFGTTQLLRFATLPGSIGSRYVRNPATGHREAGAGWYFGAQSILAVKNTIASLIGGVQVDANGKVIDHALMRKQAVAVERAQREQERGHKRAGAQVPAVQVTQVATHEKPLAAATPEIAA